MLQKIRYRLCWNYAGHLNRQGHAPVALEIRQGSQKIYISSNVLLAPSQWDRGRVTDHPNAEKLTVYLTRWMHTIEEIELDALLHGHQMSVSQLKTAVKSGTRPSATLGEFVDAVIEGSERSAPTKASYQTLVREVEKFDSHITISTVNHDWIVRWKSHMRSCLLSDNTIKGRLKQLHALTEEALKRDIIATDPFKHIVIGNMTPKAVWLTMTEIRRIERVTLDDKESRVRDLFLLGCYSGLRYGDLTTLEEADIRHGILTKTMYKTKHTVQIPVGTLFWGKPLEIINKYTDITVLSHCVRHNSTANKIIKEVARKAGVKKKVSFHVGRKSAASNLSLLGMPLQEISKVLGHQRSSTTDSYYLFSKTESLFKTSR
ncbi:MAG: site-specific integrase [Prevotella sp.]|nr:site-specific integrase [Prevotella sp.]